MAYIDQKRKAELAPKIKAICKKHGVRASIGVRHHSTLVLNIAESKIDFFGQYASKYGTLSDGYIQVNPYSIDTNFTGIAGEFLQEVYEAMMAGNHNNSDMQTDYFDVGWYVSINIGSFEKPYRLTA
jgi:hypothetical protein